MAAQLRAAYARLGFSQQVSQSVAGGQGVDSLEELARLSDDSVANLCKVIRRPGGAITAADDAAAPNPGERAPNRAEESTKLAARFARHRLRRISRPTVAADVTLQNVRAMTPLRKHEESHKNPTDVPAIDDKDWPATFGNLGEVLVNALGEEKNPSLHAVRENQAVPPPAGDPVTNYATAGAETKIRAPGVARMETILSIEQWKSYGHYVQDVSRCALVNTYKGRAAQRGGRGAYFSAGAKGHCLGPSSVNDQAGAAERQLDQLSYNGESKRWTFENKAHKKIHLTLEGLAHMGIPHLILALALASS